MTKLLPCPFCGLDINDDEGCFPTNRDHSRFEARCGNPNCFAHEPSDESYEAAVARWNTRATAAPVVVGEDAKRLDWLVANQGLLTVCSGRWFSAAGANVYEADTARGAIDAAIANQA